MRRAMYWNENLHFMRLGQSCFLLGMMIDHCYRCRSTMSKSKGRFGTRHTVMLRPPTSTTRRRAIRHHKERVIRCWKSARRKSTCWRRARVVRSYSHWWGRENSLHWSWLAIGWFLTRASATAICWPQRRPLPVDKCQQIPTSLDDQCTPKHSTNLHRRRAASKVVVTFVTFVVVGPSSGTWDHVRRTVSRRFLASWRPKPKQNQGHRRGFVGSLLDAVLMVLSMPMTQLPNDTTDGPNALPPRTALDRSDWLERVCLCLFGAPAALDAPRPTTWKGRRLFYDLPVTSWVTTDRRAALRPKPMARVPSSACPLVFDRYLEY